MGSPLKFRIPPIAIVSPRHLHWLGQGAWAMSDQALFAGSNFLLNVLLTRWLGAQEYGAFAVGFSVLIFIGSIHVALLGEPMLVFGAGHYKDDPGRYLAAAIYGHLLIGIAALVLMSAAGIAFQSAGHRAMGMSLIGFGFGCPCILLLWMMRRACYMLSVPRKAALAGASYLAVMAGGLLALYRAHRMSLGSSIAVLDVSSLLAALGLAVALRPRFAGVSWPYLREVLTKHLHFGRWGVGTGVLYFISGQLFYITLATFDGLDASAALRAMINLLAPATLVSFGFASLLAPTLVAARQRGTFGRLVATAMSLLVPISLCYWIALALLAPAIFRLLYRGRYIEHAHLLWLLGASLVATSAIDILGAALRAREEPKEAFLAFAASATFALVAGTALTYMWGITGAVLSIVGAGAVAASVLARFYARRRSPADPDTTAS